MNMMRFSNFKWTKGIVRLQYSESSHMVSAEENLQEIDDMKENLTKMLSILQKTEFSTMICF